VQGLPQQLQMPPSNSWTSPSSPASPPPSSSDDDADAAAVPRGAESLAEAVFFSSSAIFLVSMCVWWGWRKRELGCSGRRAREFFFILSVKEVSRKNG